MKAITQVRAASAALALLAVVVAPAVAAAPAPHHFSAGATYRGRTSQHEWIRIHVSRTGRTAGVDAWVFARCTGSGHYAYGFRANFHQNPARIHDSTMSVSEVDRNLPPDRQVPATRVVRQHFFARAMGTGRRLSGVYRLTETLTDGRHCRTGRVQFAARTRRK